jgi:RNA polymerase sigma-70 factor (ECF subfamily)
MTTSAETLPDNPNLAAEMRPALVKYFKRKTGNAVEAEDLAQDVLVRALTHADWKTPSQAKGYIFRSAVNRWRDRHRRLLTHGTNVTWEEHHELVLGVENSPERVLIVREELSEIAQVLDGLNVRTRTVLMLIKLEQMKAATVADMLGISVSAVNKHLANALAHLAVLRNRLDSL